MYLEVCLPIAIKREKKDAQMCMRTNEVYSNASHTFKPPCLANLMHTFITNHSKVIYLSFIFI